MSGRKVKLGTKVYCGDFVGDAKIILIVNKQNSSVITIFFEIVIKFANILNELLRIRIAN